MYNKAQQGTITNILIASVIFVFIFGGIFLFIGGVYPNYDVSISGNNTNETDFLKRVYDKVGNESDYYREVMHETQEEQAESGDETPEDSIWQKVWKWQVWDIPVTNGIKGIIWDDDGAGLYRGLQQGTPVDQPTCQGGHKGWNPKPGDHCSRDQTSKDAKDQHEWYHQCNR